MKFADLPVGSWFTHQDVGGSFCMKITDHEILVFRHVGKIVFGDDVEVTPVLTAVPGDE